LIRRMRSSLDYNDPSFQVRQQNQANLRLAMKEYPYGVGVGLSANRGGQYGYYPKTKDYPTDSWFVMIWVDTGTPGLIFYILMQICIIAGGGYIIVFKIKNKELRFTLLALLAGYAGGLAGGYANEVLGFPNGVLIYSSIAFVYAGPIIDKQIEKLKKTEMKTL
jgi:teichuronic acid biosynthesis protein TuaE